MEQAQKYEPYKEYGISGRPKKETTAENVNIKLVIIAS